MRIQFFLLAALLGCQDTSTDTVRNHLGDTCEEWEVDPSPTVIWPPNHKLHTFTLDDCVTINECEPEEPVCGDGVVEGTEQCDDANTNPFDGCDQCVIVDINPDKRGTGVETAALAPSSSATTLSITSITSNEPVDVNQGGDGHTTGFDAVIIDSQTFALRAERQGRLDGRTYNVNFVDQDGNEGTCTFIVPHDRGH